MSANASPASHHRQNGAMGVEEDKSDGAAGSGAAAAAAPEDPIIRYKCTLSPRLKKMAKEELGENPLFRRLSFEGMRQMMKKRPDINFTRDERVLLRFLRCKKFELDKAFKALVRYYELREKHPDYFGDFRKSSIKPVLEDGFPVVLNERDSVGRPIVALRIIKWDTNKYNILQIAKAVFMTMESLVQDEEAQVTGINLIIDLEGISTNMVLQMGPHTAKKTTAIFQNCVPVRLCSIHLVNEPAIFDAALVILRAFMAEKMRKRLWSHGTDYASLHQHFPASILFSNWGGDLGPYTNDDWKAKFLAEDKDFAPAANEGVVAKPKKGKKIKGHNKYASVGSAKKQFWVEPDNDPITD